MPLAALHKPIYQHRISVLSELIVDVLDNHDKLLDIGSGYGELGNKVLEGCSKSVLVEGIEKFPRGGEKIKTHSFDGYEMPFEDGAYDVVMMADVVHHEEDYMRLLKEAVRVAKRTVIIKDHVPTGFLGYQRICFMDWAANNPYGVKCLYRYFSTAEWNEIYQKLDLEVREELTSIKLYQEPFNFIFGNSLEYFCVLNKNSDN